MLTQRVRFPPRQSLCIDEPSNVGQLGNSVVIPALHVTPAQIRAPEEANNIHSDYGPSLKYGLMAKGPDETIISNLQGS